MQPQPDHSEKIGATRMLTKIQPPLARLHAKEFTAELKARGYRFFSGVPCSYFKDAIEEIGTDPALTYVGAVNEGAALALCAGAVTAGQKSACFLQNSGFGNLVNPLTSLSLIYRIPTLLFISMRAYPDGAQDEPQHRIVGATLRGILDAFEVPNEVLPRERKRFEQALARADRVIGAGGIAALLIEKGAMTGDKKPATSDRYPMSRMDAISILAEGLPEDAVVVSTTGMASRELFAFSDRARNFYMQGSMGHAMAMGLGVAIAAARETPVVILDGDGAAFMHMGSMATIGERAPGRFLHFIIDNESYGTTGNQATPSAVIHLEKVAAACGYVRTASCDDPAELRSLLAEFRAIEGPTCLLAKVNQREGENVPRVTDLHAPDQTAERVRLELLHA
jgi:phosphonopyruvate decarboxylase